MLVGGLFFNVEYSQITPWLVGTLISGLAIFLIDLHGSFIAVFEVRGIGVLVKLGLLSLLPLLEYNHQIYLLIILTILSSLLSHSRRSLRHRSFMSRAFLDKYGVRE